MESLCPSVCLFTSLLVSTFESTGGFELGVNLMPTEVILPAYLLGF